METTSLQQTAMTHKSDSYSQNSNLTNKKITTVTKNVSHVNKDKFGKTKSCNGVVISDMTRLLFSDEWRK